jgi:hypothetical protein
MARVFHHTHMSEVDIGPYDSGKQTTNLPMNSVVKWLSRQMQRYRLLMHSRLGCLVLLFASPANAWASDPSGMATILFGVPGMLCAIALAGLLLRIPSRPWRRVLARLVFTPVLLVAALISLDAKSMLGRGIADTVFALVYFGLVGILVLLVRRLWKSPLSLDGHQAHAKTDH